MNLDHAELQMNGNDVLMTDRTNDIIHWIKVFLFCFVFSYFLKVRM
jgi:hypothetical protein